MNAVSSLALVALFGASGDTVLLEFTSQRCQHCLTMQPVVAQLAQQGIRVQAIDADQQPQLRNQFRVTGVPTFVAVSGDREIGRIEGATSYEKLAELVQRTEGGVQKTEVRDQGEIVRGQVGVNAAGLAPEQAAQAATVRVKVEDASGYGFGTGTIIDTHDGEALVVTCGHLFRESKGQGKITADLFASGSAKTVAGQLIAYDLNRDIALISLRTSFAVPAVTIAPPGQTVRPGDRAFTIGCDKGADPTIRMTQITAVNKYQGKPNYTAAGQPIDGRSGGGLFTADGLLIGICNAADPADDEGLYAGLASIHWQLDQVGQSQIYQRAAQLAAARNTTVPSAVIPASASFAMASPPTPPQLPMQMPATAPTNTLPTTYEQTLPVNAPAMAAAIPSQPMVVAGDDTEIVFIVRSKRDPAQRSEVFVVDQAPPDLIARITHAAHASGQQRAALARAASQSPRTAAANTYPAQPAVVRGQSTDY